ncbi:GGDEF domain-containing protein [Roseibium sp.]|uniref:GGDEF domain-containing protein n=1 Tax=Roseibium sp. TaxID=1936156 RepID=UPI003B52FDDC
MDLYTLIVAVGVINAVFAVVYFITYFHLRHLKYILLWGISTAILAANGLYYVNADKIPPTLLYTGSTLFLLSGLCLRYMAARDFGGRPASYLQLAIPCLLTGLVAAPFLAEGDHSSATTVAYFAYGIIGVLATWEYLRDIKDGLISRYSLIACYGIVTLAFTHRAFLGLFEPPVLGEFGLPLDEAQATHQLTLLIGSCASAALCLAIAFEKTMKEQQEAAHRDHLTGTMNRRALESAIDQLLTNDTNHSMALAHADLDHFKSINDTFGHNGGDQALIHFVKLVKQHPGPNDLFARIGGEEFVLVFLNRSQQEVSQLLDNIRTDVAKTPLLLPEGACSMTVSTGFTYCELPSGRTLAELMRTADKALYKAKHGGRNRICFEPREQRWRDRKVPL